MRLKIITVAVIAIFLAISFLPSVSSASIPPLGAQPSSLPSIPYNYDGSIYNITSSNWTSYFDDIYNNRAIVSFNWSGNATEDLILFDLSYKGLNPYGLQIVTQLSSIGEPSLKNFTIAFNRTKSMSSQVPGYTNIQALNAGAYPGFSWSVPKIKKPAVQDTYIGIIVALIASIFVLYFIFNRKR
ncbi:MAG: hypothetical protein AAE986_02245 [Thermoplasmataceae archaeon]|jgi:hypothetical protein